MSWIPMHGTERTRPEPTESEKKENKPKAAKILRAEKLDVSQQTKNKCRRKTRFLETNQKNLAKENKSGRPFILYVVLFSVSRRKLRSFHFSYFPAQNVFISLEYIIEISYWTRKTILTEKYETWFPTEDHAYNIMISQLMKSNEITRKSKHRCASPTWLSCLSWLSWLSWSSCHDVFGEPFYRSSIWLSEGGNAC